MGGMTTTSQNQTFSGSSNQNTASNALSNLNTSQSGSTTGTQSTQQATGPSALGQQYLAAGTTPAYTTVQNYQNPYTQDVTNATMAQLSQMFGQQQQQVVGSAIQNNALGGNRQAVAQAQLAGQQGLAAGSTLANLNAQGYSQGLQAAQTGNQQNLTAAGMAGTQATGQSSTQQLTNAISSALGNLASTQQSSGTYNGVQQAQTTPGWLSWLSDERVKENIKPIGKTYDGQTVYKYNYTGQPGLTRLGLIAQEVEHKHPEAVGHTGGLDGLRTVNYDEATRDSEGPRRDAGGGVSDGGMSMLTQLLHSAPQQPNLNLQPRPSAYPSAHAKSILPSPQSMMQSMQPQGSPISGNPTSGASGTPGAAGAGEGSEAGSAYSTGAAEGAGAGAGEAGASGAEAGAGAAAGADAGAAAGGGEGLGSLVAVLFARDGGAMRRKNGGLARFADGGDAEYPPVTWMNGEDTGEQPHTGMTADDWAAEGETWRPAGASQPPPSIERASPAPRLAPKTGTGPDQGVVYGGEGSPEPAPQAGGLAGLGAVGGVSAAPITGYGSNAGNVVQLTPGATQSGVEALRQPSRAETPVVENEGVRFRNPTHQAVYDELRSAGLSDSAIRGVFANYHDESRFDPTLRHPDQPRFGGEAHYAHGLAQWGGDKWKAFEFWQRQNAPGTDWRDPSVQARFQAWDLQTNHPDLVRRMNAATPEQAAQMYLREYERPAAGPMQERSSRYGQGVPELSAYNGPGAQISTRTGLPAIARDIQAAPGKGLSAVQSGASDAVEGAQTALSGLGRVIGIGGGAQPAQGQAAQPGQGGIPSSGILGSVLGIPRQVIGDNLLTRALANPLNMSSPDQQTLMRGIAGALQSGNIGAGLNAGMNYQQQQEAAHRQAAQDAMKLQMEFAKLGQPVKMGQTTDEWGRSHETYGVWNPATQSYQPVQPGQAAQAARTSAAAPGTQGAAPAAGTPADHIEREAEAVATYHQAPYIGRQAQTPHGMQVMERAREIAQAKGYAYDATAYPAKLAAQRSFEGSGKDRQNIQSLGTAIYHTAKWDEAIDGLGNFSNANAINPIRNASRGQYSTEFRQAQAKFDAAKTAVIDEVNRAVKGGQITVSEGEEWKARINSNSAPDALHTTAHTFSDILMGRLQQAVSTYNEEFHLKPGDPGYKTPLDFFDPATKKMWAEISGHWPGTEAAGRPHGAAPQQAATPAAPSAVPPSLPPGSQYSPSRQQWRDPSGRLYNAQGEPIQ